MRHRIEILFDNNNKIKNFINKSNELLIKNEIFKINKVVAWTLMKYKIVICFDYLETKINILNNIFDFFIEHGCYYYEDDHELYIIYDHDKELYYKSVYWVLNSNIFDDQYLLTFKSLV